VVPPPPPWWSSASCRGDGPEHWTIIEGETHRAIELRAVCERCPVKGQCLRDATALPTNMRSAGPMRAGTTGHVAWRRADQIIADLDPQTDEEWSAAAVAVIALAGRGRAAA
jgi:Transcription factor WhiB